MARPREFDEEAVTEALVKQFWAHGFAASSMRDLAEATGVTCASLYNAFGDKRALYEKALGRYLDDTIGERLVRCRRMPPRKGIEVFFAEILTRSLNDSEHRGCMLVNAALEVAPNDDGFATEIGGRMSEIEAFFRDCVAHGQADGSISSDLPAVDLGRHLLALLMGVRVLSRVRPEPALLEGAIRAGLALLDRSAGNVAGDPPVPPETGDAR